MLDADAQSREDALWVAGMNGIIYPNLESLTRISDAINQAFSQSPYLGAGKTEGGN
jgi:hypothetical protein